MRVVAVRARGYLSQVVHAEASQVRRPPAQRLWVAVWISLVAFVIHLVPLFLPRDVPAVELELASRMPDPRFRRAILEPLLENPKAGPGDLRRAAELILPASVPLARTFLAEARRRGPREVVDNELLLARICAAEADRACARAALERACAAAPKDDARAELAMADFAAEEGDVAGALSALARAFSRSPADVELGLRYARALGAAGREDEAEAVFTALSVRLPPSRQRLEHGLLALARGDLSGAALDFEAAVRAQPANPEPRYFLGVSLFQAGDWERAEVALREADTLLPSDFRALALLCALQREQGRVEEAAASRALLEKRLPEQRALYAEACPP